MRKIFFIFLVSLIALSLVLAVQGNSRTTGQQGIGPNASSNIAGSDITQAGQGRGSGSQTNTEQQTQNQGENTQLQNQVQTQVQSGTYMNQAGKKIQVQAGQGNEVKLKSGNVEAKTTMVMTQERDQVQNRTKLKVKLSNGLNAEIKVMPDTASEIALERLKAKCEDECTIELKEVGTGNQVKAAYEIKTQKQSKILGLFQAKMQVQAQVDAENGEIIKVKKPWWAFLATE